MAAPTRDHIQPRSKGVTLMPGNKALACHRRNTDKRIRSLASCSTRQRRSVTKRNRPGTAAHAN